MWRTTVLQQFHKVKDKKNQCKVHADSIVFSVWRQFYLGACGSSTDDLHYIFFFSLQTNVMLNSQVCSQYWDWDMGLDLVDLQYLIVQHAFKYQAVSIELKRVVEAFRMDRERHPWADCDIHHSLTHYGSVIFLQIHISRSRTCCWERRRALLQTQYQCLMHPVCSFVSKVRLENSRSVSSLCPAHSSSGC